MSSSAKKATHWQDDINSDIDKEVSWLENIEIVFKGVLGSSLAHWDHLVHHVSHNLCSYYIYNLPAQSKKVKSVLRGLRNRRMQNCAVIQCGCHYSKQIAFYTQLKWYYFVKTGIWILTLCLQPFYFFINHNTHCCSHPANGTRKVLYIFSEEMES